MNTKSHSRLIAMSSLILGMLISLPSFAERPYADHSPWATEAKAIEEGDYRPAAINEEAESSTEPETISETETQSTGDVLSMPAAEQAPAPTAEAVAQTVRTLDFPRRGMTQDKVQNELGRPGEIVPAVGTPPITRWIYEDRVVYFEYASVIHVVAK